MGKLIPLTEGQKEIIESLYSQGMKWQDIAKRLGKNRWWLWKRYRNELGIKRLSRDMRGLPTYKSNLKKARAEKSELRKKKAKERKIAIKKTEMEYPSLETMSFLEKKVIIKNLRDEGLLISEIQSLVKMRRKSVVDIIHSNL